MESEDIIVNVLTKYEDLSDVFEKTENLIFSDHDLYDYTINLKSEKTFLFSLLYNLSAMKLSMFRKYLKWNLQKKKIYHFIFSAVSLLLFTFKKNEELHLCVNYWFLNNIIIKNCYSLFFIIKTLNHLQKAQIFIKLNVKNAYNWIRIKDKNKWKTAFQIHFELFKYLILFFELINASVLF